MIRLRIVEAMLSCAHLEELRLGVPLKGEALMLGRRQQCASPPTYSVVYLSGPQLLCFKEEAQQANT